MERDTGLDNLKAVLVAGVILAHAAMTYGATGTWIFEARDYGGAEFGDALEAITSLFVVLGAMFAIGLFLYVAALFTPDAIRRKGAGGFTRDRIIRLGTPLLLYIVIVVPLLNVFIDATVGSDRGVATDAWQSLRELHSGPMWFVAILLVASVGAALWVRIAGLPAREPSAFRLRYLALAAAAIAVGSFAIRLAFPLDSDQLFDLHVWLWPQCAVLFMLGLFSAQRGWLEPVAPSVRRWCAFVASAALVVGFTVLAVTHPSEAAAKGGAHWPAALLATMEGVYSVTMSVWVLSFFQRHLCDSRVLQPWWSRNAYGAFVAQGPVLVVLGVALRAGDVPPAPGFLVLAVAGVFGCFLTADVCRHSVGLIAAARHRLSRR